jgi:hypothetical protein
MQFFSSIQYTGPETKITYNDKLILSGSCFTEHIGKSLQHSKFQTLFNPDGILFDAVQVARSVLSWLEKKPVTESDIFQYQEIWHSWMHHGKFSDMDAHNILAHILQSQNEAHDFLLSAQWLVLTLGSAYTYQINENMPVNYLGGLKPGNAVANCHKLPGKWFDKQLLSVPDIITAYDNLLYRLKQANPSIKLMFTISPVRHVRDGIIENNRSKARLIEAVHHLVNKFDNIYYFPAYELVIDVLRDYRFYDTDLAHPNYAATEYVMNFFFQHCFSSDTLKVREEIQQLATAFSHRPRFPNSTEHKKFIERNRLETERLAAIYHWLDWQKELSYFTHENNECQ